MRVESFPLFPTRLVTVQFDGTSVMDEEICRFLAAKAAGDFDMHPDSLNLLKMADQCPAIARAGELLKQGLAAWLKAEGIAGPTAADVVLFSSYSERGGFTLAHNHNADVVAVYYARVPEHSRPAVLLPTPEDEYFAAEDGVLLLHDPRFNANLAAVGVRDYVKVFPRPGLMVLFPGYLWHSVTPHLGDTPRVALSANFRLRWGGGDNAVTWPLA
jgi:hypothetical protein